MDNATRAPERFVEPDAERTAGRRRYVVPESPYEEYMRLEGLPVHRGIGVHDVRELALGDWERTGGRGAFIYLDGVEENTGLHVLEVPAGAVLEPEQHIYEKVVFVVEGAGTTEVLGDDASPAPSFEWGPGSLFAVPLNVRHRLVNATRQRALMLVSSTAPSVINLFGSGDFVFANPWRFTDRYDDASDFFAYRDELLSSPATGRAVQRTNFIPDIVGGDLPLDNQMSPGYRRVEPHMASGRQYMFIGEHETGRYSRAHSHPSGAVLVCIKGKGYTYTWPKELGPHPWETGHQDRVARQDYVAGGMVAAAPGGGDWIHQHFGVGREPLRLLVFYGMRTPLRFQGRAGQQVTSVNVAVSEGGRGIPYEEEDPHIRAEFVRMLEAEGIDPTVVVH